jgi:hypothetical protein
MKIEYAENPLASKIYLDISEKKLLFWRYMWEMLDEEIYNFYYWMKDPEKQKKWYKELDNKPALEAHEELEKNMHNNPLNTVYEKLNSIWEKMIHTEYDESRIQSFIEALQDEHHGDCVNQPSSCLKCYAEDVLDFDSVPNLKHWGGTAAQINGAFFNPDTEKKDRKIEHAIDFLKSKDYNDNEYKKWDLEYIEKWKQQTAWAIEYLEYYKKEILNK